MDASRSIDEISVRNGVDAGFVEDVLQIYTTHRGIDIQGIMEHLRCVVERITYHNAVIYPRYR